MKVILALDESAFSETAMQSVAARDWPAGTEITIAHVVDLDIEIHDGKETDDLMNLSPYKKGIVDMAKKFIDTRVAELAERLPDCKVKGTVLQGRPSDAIIFVVDREKPDLVVLGSHGRTGLPRLILGSVAEAVLHQATCSVEIVKHRKPGSKDDQEEKESAKGYVFRG